MNKKKSINKNIKQKLINNRYKIYKKNLYNKILLNLKLSQENKYEINYKLINNYYSFIYKSIKKNIISLNKGKKSIIKIIKKLNSLKNI
jgi:hypothetical protein